MPDDANEGAATEIFEPEGATAEDAALAMGDALPDALPEPEPKPAADVPVVEEPAAEPEPEAAVEPEAEAEAEAAEPEGADTDALMAEALSVGLSKEYAQAMLGLDESLLARAVDEQYRVLKVTGEREIAAAGPVADEPAKATAGEAGVPKAPVPGVPDEPLDLGLDPDLLDPEVMGALQKISGRYAGEMRELRTVIEGLQRRDAERETAQRAQQEAAYGQWLDSKVSTAPEVYKAVLATPEGRGRVEVTLNALAVGLSKQGVRPDWERLFDRALRVEFADLNEKAIEKSVVDRTRAQLKKRAGQITPRPTHRESTADTPTRRAHDVAKRIYQERGIPDRDADLDLDAVPDLIE